LIWSIYADLSRPLTHEERAAVGSALDDVVPSGGCVGLQNGPNDEVYFVVEAPSAIDARTAASRYVDVILDRARLADVGYEIHLQPSAEP
jgi:hypothetical protein